MSTLFDLIHRAGQITDAAYVNEASTEGLTPRQLAALRVIERHPGCSQTYIVEQTGIDRSTLADIIKRMKVDGMLTRRKTKRRHAGLCGRCHRSRIESPASGRERAQAG